MMKLRRLKKTLILVMIFAAVLWLLDFALGYPMAFRVGDWRQSLGKGPAGKPVYLAMRLLEREPSHKSVPVEDKARKVLEKNESLNTNSPYTASVTMGDERFRLMNRRVMLAPPASKIAFRLTIPPGAELFFGYGVWSKVGAKRGNGARFIVEWRGPEGTARLFKDEVVNKPAGFWDKSKNRRKIFYRYLRPKFRKWGGGYQDARLDLSAYAGREGELWFITENISDDKQRIPSPAVWSSPEVWVERLEGKGKDMPLNVILFMVEATPAGLLESCINEPVITPNIREFSRSAVIFDRFYTSGDRTRLSIFPFFTSRNYRPTLGLPDNMYYMASLIKARFYQANYPSLAEAFSMAGYKTALIGCNAYFLPTREIGLDIGFDEQDVTLRRYYNSEDTLHGAMEWLRENGNRPFFLYIHYDGPANVFEPPCLEYMLRGLKVRTDDSRWNYRKKLAQEIGADTAFGQVLDALETLGIRDRTVVVFNSDHGSCLEPTHSFGVVRSYSNLWHTEFRHGRTMFAEDIHVPLIIDRPIGPGEQRHISANVTTLDIFPTLVDLILPEPDPEFKRRMNGISGKSLAPLLVGKADSDLPGRQVIYTLSNGGEGMIVDGRYHYFRRNREFYKILYPDSGMFKVEEYGLFDLESDPRELNNLADSRPDLLSRMQELLERARPEETMLRFVYMNHDAGKVRGSLGIAGDAPSLIMTYPEDRPPVNIRQKKTKDNEGIIEFETELQGPTGLILDRPVEWIKIEIDSRKVQEEELRIGRFGLPLLKGSGCKRPGNMLDPEHGNGDLTPLESRTDFSEKIFLADQHPMRYIDEPGLYFYTMKFSDFVNEAFSDESLSPAVRSALKQWGYIE